MPGRWRCVHPAGLRWSAAAGGLAPVGVKQHGTAASILISRRRAHLSRRLPGRVKNTKSVQTSVARAVARRSASMGDCGTTAASSSKERLPILP